MIDAVFLGSIGVLAETSDIQRRAYNAALGEAGLAWEWDPSTYRSLLASAGGRRRLRMLADATATPLGDDEIARIHQRKTEIACREVVESGVALRPGVGLLVATALERGLPVALVTSTSRANIDAIATAAGEQLPLERFAAVITTDDVERGKPAPDAYGLALATVGTEPSRTLAIEDTATSALAAVAAGLRVVVTPGQYTDDQVVVGADLVLEALGTDGEFHPDLVHLLG